MYILYNIRHNTTMFYPSCLLSHTSQYGFTHSHTLTLLKRVYVWYTLMSAHSECVWRSWIVRTANHTKYIYILNILVYVGKGNHFEMKIPMLTPRQHIFRSHVATYNIHPKGSGNVSSKRWIGMRTHTKGVCARVSNPKHSHLHTLRYVCYVFWLCLCRFLMMEFTSRTIANTTDQSTFDASADQSHFPLVSSCEPQFRVENWTPKIDLFHHSSTTQSLD